jgi:hypothetical protein
MKIANTLIMQGKAVLAKVATIGLLAGAVTLAAPAAAHAQVGFGVRIGGPRVAVGVGVYAPPVYAGPRYYAPPVIYPAPAYRHPYFYDRHFYGRRYWR